MKLFATLALAMLIGCAVPSLNSPYEKPQASSSQQKPCGCGGNMECCTHAKDGTLCCKPDDCSCNQVTLNQGCGSCAKQ